MTYIDYFLKFVDEEEWQQLKNDDIFEQCIVDCIGRILDKEGYHVNVRAKASFVLPATWLSKAINPVTPMRCFAGDAKIYMQS